MAKKAAKKTARRAPTAGNTSRAVKRTAPAVRKELSSGDLRHRLDALLHTMRCIAQHEDELCTLLHDARRTNRVSAALVQELRSILQELPAEEYVADLHAVEEAILAT